MQSVTMPDGSSSIKAAADLQPTESVFIMPFMLAASRPDLEQLIRQDSHIRAVCADAAQLPGGTAPPTVDEQAVSVVHALPVWALPETSQAQGFTPPTAFLHMQQACIG